MTDSSITKAPWPEAIDTAPQQMQWTVADGYETVVYRFGPQKNARSAVLYAHGIQSHPAWFFRSASALAESGVAVYLPTRRGSGENTVARGHAANGAQLLEDVDRTVTEILRREGGSRVSLLGVSWGGKLLTAYALRRTERVGRIVLVAPGIVPKVDVPWMTKLAIAACLLVRPAARFDIPLSDPALFTDNPAMQEYIRRDPQALRQATARFLWVSRGLDLRLARARAGQLEPDTTLLLAERDDIIDNPATRSRLERLAGDRLRVQTLTGAHTLEFNPDPEPLHKALLAGLGVD